MINDDGHLVADCLLEAVLGPRCSAIIGVVALAIMSGCGYTTPQPPRRFEVYPNIIVDQETETRFFCQLRESNERVGYEFYDHQRRPLSTTEDGWFEHVASVKISLPCGRTLSHRFIDLDILTMILME